MSYQEEVAALAVESGDISYIIKWGQILDLLAAGLDAQGGQLGLVSGQAAYAVPLGLQQIFDRSGLIGAASYAFTGGVLSGPDYNLAVNPGAFWSGSYFFSHFSAANLSLALLATGDYFLNLDSLGNPSVAAAPTAGTVRQFHWDAGSHTVSAAALYTGVSILFSGADYADMLTSAARAKSFTKVADRLEEIEQALGAVGVQIITPANTVNINWSLGITARLLLDRSNTTINMTGAQDGQRCILELTQDEVGGRAISFGAMVKVGTDLTAPVPLSAGINLTDELGFVYHQPSGLYRYDGFARGF